MFRAFFFAAIMVLLGPGGALRADTVKLTNRPAFRNVSIRDFRPDVLIFRGVSGEYLRKPLPYRAIVRKA
ncbi:MAG: hypothetical protein KAY37_03500 [Phycisphaerae bacterium]|nr:hypothetical protein [Phycisphaerae bacterium]